MYVNIQGIYLRHGTYNFMKPGTDTWFQSDASRWRAIKAVDRERDNIRKASFTSAEKCSSYGR